MTRGKRRKRKQRTGLWLKIRLEMLSSMVLWFPPCGFHPNGVFVGNDRENDRETTETTGGNDGNDEGEMTETTDWFVA